MPRKSLSRAALLRIMTVQPEVNIYGSTLTKRALALTVECYGIAHTTNERPGKHCGLVNYKLRYWMAETGSATRNLRKSRALHVARCVIHCLCRVRVR